MSIGFKEDLESIAPEWTGETPKGVKAFFTCRTGGVSSGPWGGPEGVMGLNLSKSTGDNAFCVKMNRQILTQCLPAEPKWISQVHGTAVIHADEAADAPEADGSWTMTPGVVACVMVADCLPVLLADREGRIVAAVHAGWRSLADGIIQEGVRAMRRALGDESFVPAVWMGPRIGAESFEVGDDVLEAMKQHLPEAEKAFTKKPDGKWLCDLAMLARMALSSVGVPDGDIADCGLSTYADAKRFFSFRRDGKQSGRHAALIWIES
ncbi:peptidoglycan editing factor PgeF [Sutterella sp.]|uniref:peptidoglycan editing factor PgeF n=1 Tax=Sutterella sp. TaxID=1981025 RepID=UPI0026E0F0DD|nr:peptidoglycan editing factor PgeF [Sutterella sp.]MDO5532009.1 peptidoglycan editing factor PgeF [Sutterella sp.]